MDAGEKYLAHMGKYQVISLSLKSMKQYSYELSYNMLQKAVEGEYSRHWPLIENSKKLTDVQMERYLRIRDLKGTENDYADSSRDNFHPRHFSLYRLRGRCKIDEKSSMEQRLPFYVKKQKTDPEEPVIYGIIRYAY